MRSRVLAPAAWLLCWVVTSCGGKASRSAGDDTTSANTTTRSTGTATDSSGGSANSTGSGSSGGSGGLGSTGANATDAVSVAAGGAVSNGSGGSGVGGGAGEHSYQAWDEACPELSEEIGLSSGECGSIAVHYAGEPSEACTIDTSFDFGNASARVAIDCDLLDQIPLGQGGASSGWAWADADEEQSILLIGDACEKVGEGVERIDIVFVCQF